MIHFYNWIGISYCYYMLLDCIANWLYIAHSRYITQSDYIYHCYTMPGVDVVGSFTDEVMATLESNTCVLKQVYG